MFDLFLGIILLSTDLIVYYYYTSVLIFTLPSTTLNSSLIINLSLTLYLMWSFHLPCLQLIGSVLYLVAVHYLAAV